MVESQCLTDLTFIVQLESEVVDLSVRREYILCANTVFETGVVNPTNGMVMGMFPLLVRANSTVKCGDDGSRQNNCTITGGDLGLALQPFGRDPESIDGTVIMGVQIFDIFLQPFSIFNLFGALQFIDCAFLVSFEKVHMPFLSQPIKKTRGLFSSGACLCSVLFWCILSRVSCVCVLLNQCSAFFSLYYRVRWRNPTC